ncbi:MAG: lysophospholipid acyltransferase family protein [Planctomycetota bacterium]|jgi:KDO2-lipid IV(A) lauroyltransferase
MKRRDIYASFPWHLRLAGRLLDAFLAFMRRMPLSASLWLGETVGGLGYRLLPGKNRIARRNLELVFGKEKNRAECNRIIKAMWRNWGRNAAEFIRFPYYTPGNINRTVEWENWEILERQREDGRGLLTITAHFGNWDLLALSSSLRGIPVYLVTKKLSSRFWNDFWMSKRDYGGVRAIFKKGAAREIMRTLRSGGLVASVLDQDTKPKEGGIFVDFFGTPASTLNLMAVLAGKRGVSVTPVYIVRTSRTRHRAVVIEPVPFIDCGDFEESVRDMTQRLVATMEPFVRTYPEQWIWIHRRWKRRPPGEEKIYQD